MNNSKGRQTTNILNVSSWHCKYILFRGAFWNSGAYLNGALVRTGALIIIITHPRGRGDAT